MAGVRDYMDAMAAAQAEQAGWLQRFADGVRADERRRVLAEVRARVSGIYLDVFTSDDAHAIRDRVLAAMDEMEDGDG